MKRASPGQITFGFTTAREMLAKLEREVVRIESSKTIEEASDHCSNAAVTAWHLVEWAWAFLKTNHKTLGLGWHRQEDFERWLFDTGCPELRHCQILATCFKHTRHSSNSGDPDFETKPGPIPGEWVNAKGEIGTWVNSNGESGYFLVGEESQWFLVEGQKRYLASQLFCRVVDFWRTFLDKYSLSVG